MEESVEKLETQLTLWSLKIDNLAAKHQKAGTPARFDAVMHVDELKALLAIAQSALLEFKAAAAGTSRRARLKAAMKRAWNDLDAALANPMP